MGALFQKHTAEEKKQKQVNENASYLAKKAAVDASDIKTAYQGREDDMKDHQDAYENNNWKAGLGLLFAGLGTGGLITDFADMGRENAENVQQTTSVEQDDDGSAYNFTIDLDGGDMGFSLVFAFAGAALIASGVKGKQAVKNLIHDKVNNLAGRNGETGKLEDAAGPPPHDIC